MLLKENIVISQGQYYAILQLTICLLHTIVSNVTLVRSARQGSVYAPSFDHGVGDPKEDDIFVNLQ